MTEFKKIIYIDTDTMALKVRGLLAEAPFFLIHRFYHLAPPHGAEH